MIWLSGTYSDTLKHLYACERKSTSMTVLVKFRQRGHTASRTASGGVKTVWRRSPSTSDDGYRETTGKSQRQQRMSGNGYTRWSALDSPGGQTGGNVSELESEFILLGLPLRLADSQRRPAWSPGDGVWCRCGVIVGSFQIPCRRQKEDKSRKRVKILQD